jgi:hypothetical protein
MIDCEFCYLTVSKSNYSKHKKTDLCKNINTIIKNNIEENKIKLNEYINKNEKLKEENILLNNKILTLEIKLKDALDKSEEYRKIVEKSATKTTVKNNYTHNNYLNYISSEPLKISEISKQVKQIVNCDTMMLDDTDFHNHIVDNILRDEYGKDKVLCTDINRKNFSYKDEKSGELVSDPELERLREQLKKGADIKYLKRDLLNKLIKEYEDNNSIGIDPYKKFYDILQKIDFGTPFVDHVAKKTYVKTKSGNEIIDDDIYE